MVDIVQAITHITDNALREAIKKEYAEVAHNPKKGYHFHTGRDAADRVGYDPALYAELPEDNIASFAGTGNPFSLGTINPGDVVVDVGSGAGFDSLIASRLAGPRGRVVGIDMTDAMIEKAKAGAQAMGAGHVEFRQGLADDLPLEDHFADVLISNGVLNLTPDKNKTLKEWARVLKPGGRMFIGDIVIEKKMSQEALDDISLWTG
jgi:arsenite methyltransferase